MLLTYPTYVRTMFRAEVAARMDCASQDDDLGRHARSNELSACVRSFVDALTAQAIGLQSHEARIWRCLHAARLSHCDSDALRRRYASCNARCGSRTVRDSYARTNGHGSSGLDPGNTSERSLVASRAR